MLKLAKAGAAAETDTTLGANENTRHFTSHFTKNGVIEYAIMGTFSGQTVTLQVSYDDGDNFVAYAAKDPTGTVANVTYTAACNDTIYAPGQRLRFNCSNGGSPDIDIQVGGDVTLYDKD
jgi:hypothetical protein